MAYRSDPAKNRKNAWASIRHVSLRVTVVVQGGFDLVDAFSWTKNEAGDGWPNATITEVLAPALQKAGIAAGAPILWIDGLDTAVLTEEQIHRLLLTWGQHTLRVGPPPGGHSGGRRRNEPRRASLRARARSRSRSPNPLSYDFGVVTTASGARVFNTSWAGIEVTDAEAGRREARSRKYSTCTSRAASPLGDSHVEDEVVDLRPALGHTEGRLVGTCTVLEKKYARMTEAARADNVRPLSILRKALDQLTVSYDSAETSSKKSWAYVGDQLRAIRQDILVQGLHDRSCSPEGAIFTVRVYSRNICWALRAGDVGQFLQCAVPLRGLLQTLRTTDDPLVPTVYVEMLACWLVYTTLTGRPQEQLETLVEVHDKMVVSATPLLVWASSVAKAYRQGKYVQYFNLRQRPVAHSQTINDCPTELLLKLKEDQVRREALRRLCRGGARAGTLRLEAVARQLGFATSQECGSWCQRIGIVLDGARVNSSACLATLDLPVTVQCAPDEEVAVTDPYQLIEIPEPVWSATARAAAAVRARARARKQARAERVPAERGAPGASVERE